MVRSYQLIKHYLRSFSGRMVLGMLAVHAVLLPLLFGTVLYIVKLGYEAQFVDSVRTQAYMLTKAVTQAISTSSAQSLLDDLVLSGQVTSGRIVDDKGRVLIGSPNVNEPKPFHEDFFFGQNNDKVYYISLPLADKSNKNLELHMGFDEQPTRDQIALAYRRGFYLGLGYFSLTMILIGLITTQVSRSLVRVREASRLIASGHFDHSLNVTSNVAEVDDLAKDLENMRRTLVGLAEALEYQAMHDSLTGLSNRAHFYDRLHQAITTSRRTGQSFCLLLVDLDKFKEINDTHGHQIGDLLIQEVATRLKNVIRESDTAARLGGDEFALLLLGADIQGGIQIAKKVIQQLRDIFTINGLRLEIGGSAGLSVYPRHGLDEEALLRCADISMYQAKNTQSGIEVCKENCRVDFAQYQQQGKTVHPIK
jgi:diguanylate cyclase (GGDEF)-like protein